MPAPLLDAAGWASVRDTAILLGNIREAARRHGVSEASACQRAKREGWAVAMVAAHAQAAKPVTKGVGNVIKPVSTVSAVIAARVDGLLTMQERRLFAAEVVRTPVGELTPGSRLAQKVKRRIRTDKDGNTTEETEVEMPNKLRALELDAQFAGDIPQTGQTNVAVQVNTGDIFQVEPKTYAKTLREVIEWERSQGIG